MKPPFPWFGGKSLVADQVWERFGSIKNYVEPFFGSGAVWFAKPTTLDCLATVNDKDGYVSNFWRAIAKDPEGVAEHADWPVNENDLHARHSWLVNQKEEFCIGKPAMATGATRAQGRESGSPPLAWFPNWTYSLKFN